ncbi:MAG: hypothetical protein PVI13_05925, partial [Desulfobacterales bacterium]
CAALSFLSAPVYGGSAVADEIISLELTNQPLGEVLEEITAATGYRFIFDESWDDFPVSASIKNEPLHRGLKRILRKLNNAVIYNSDRTIKIVIYDETGPSANHENPSIGSRSSDSPAYQFPVTGIKPSPPSARREYRDAIDVADENTPEDDDEPTAAEPDEAEAAAGEQNENSVQEAEEETAAKEEPQQGEETAGENQARPPEPSSSGS